MLAQPGDGAFPTFDGDRQIAVQPRVQLETVEETAVEVVHTTGAGER